MPYIGKQPTKIPLTSDDIADGAISSADIADLDAAKLTGTVNNARISLDAAEIPNLDTAKVTSGTFADARFPATLPAASGVNLTSLNATNLGSGTVPTARLGTGTASSSTFLRGDSTYAEAGGGKVVQSVYTLNNTNTSMSATTNRRSTSIPQNSWGTEVMTRAITPTNSSNLLYIRVIAHVGVRGSSTENTGILMLFQDTTANALSSTVWYHGGGGDEASFVNLFWAMVAGTTSSTTFKVRIGGENNPNYLNGSNQGDLLGGNQYSSIVVQELSA